MTKKDYELIADALQKSLPHYDIDNMGFEDRCRFDAWQNVVEKLADGLQGDNPRFNREKFLERVFNI